MATPILPICDVVGTSVHLAQQGIDIFDHQAVRDSSSKARIVKLGTTGKPVTTPGSDKEYWIPSNMRLIASGGHSEMHELICETGKEMSERFSVSASLGASYFGVSASVSSQYNYESTFKSTSLYGICSFDQRIYSVVLETGWYENINEDMVGNANALPLWKVDHETYEMYKAFFHKWGTHIVVEGFMGTRYQLRIEQQETTQAMKESFALHVKVEYKAIMSSEVGYENEHEYKEYLKRRETQCKVLGGDPSKGGILARNPTSNDAFLEWQNSRSTGATDALLNIRVDSLGTFLMNSPEQAHKIASERLKPALDYFSCIGTVEGMLVVVPPQFAAYLPAWFECELTSLPGLEIIPDNVHGWTVRRISPSHIRVERAGSTQGSVSIPVRITAPMIPLDVTLRGNDVPSTKGLWLSPVGGISSTLPYRTSVSITGREGNIHIPSLKHWGHFTSPALPLAEQSSINELNKKFFDEEEGAGQMATASSD
ncbi:hypothetical protein CNMCM6457_001793 [Aspergillus fumigatiaffinis]|nr:hypothetical protein CNMCM6457_001793 [Aspergillus fumigatiaffinis]